MINHHEAENNLDDVYYPISTNVDQNGKVFVSTMEGIKYPFIGVQWHPERNVFEWWPNDVTDHTPESIKAVGYMSEYFVNQVR